MALVWTDVTSSQLSKIGYDAETLKARILFSNGSEYEYDDVPESVVNDIINAESVGRQFNATLKYGFNYRRLS